MTTGVKYKCWVAAWHGRSMQHSFYNHFLFTFFLQTALFSIVNTKYLELKIRGKVKFKCIYLHLRVTVKCSDVMLVSSGNVIFEAVTV